MFKQFDYYKPNYDEVINRFEKFYGAVDEGSTGNFVYRALLDSDLAIYKNLKLNLYNFDNDDDMDKYIEDLCTELHLQYDARRDVLDDTIPVVTVILGIGDYSAFVAGDIVFTEDTSWSQPILKNLEDWKDIEEIGESKWYKKFMCITERLLEIARPCGIPYLRGFFSPLDLAQALRGSDLYIDFYDNPKGVHELLDFCTTATIKFAEDIANKVNEYLGKTEYGTWFVNGYINMSEDIACMISPELYREFGAPYTQRVIDYFGKGLLHCHSRALYIVPELCKLKNVKNIWIATDPNQPKPIDEISDLIEKSNNVCLSIDCESFEEIEANIDIAKAGNIAFCTPVKDIEEANRITEFIREHSNI